MIRRDGNLAHGAALHSHGDTRRRDFKLVHVALDDHVILAVVDHDDLDAGGGVCRHADLAVHLGDGQSADVGFINDLDGVDAAAADDGPAGDGHAVQRDIAAAHAVADDEVAGDGDILQHHAGHVHHDAAGEIVGIGAGLGDIGLDNAVHDDRKVGAGDVRGGIEVRAVAAGIARGRHGGHAAFRPGSHLGAVRELRQRGVAARGQLEDGGQRREGLLTGDGRAGIELFPAAHQGLHMDGDGHLIRVPRVRGHVGVAGDVALLGRAEGVIQDGRHFRAGEIGRRSEFAAGAFQQAVCHGRLQRGGGIVVGHVRELRVRRQRRHRQQREHHAQDNQQAQQLGSCFLHFVCSSS